ncbi:MAG: host attachment family protein [Pseudomonadota bacterium]
MVKKGLVKPKRWVVACDSTDARIYSLNGWQFHDLVWESTNSSGRVPERKLTSDRPGFTSTPLGYGQHWVDQKNTHKNEARSRFLRKVSDFLLRSKNKGQYDRLVICAPPLVLGVLRKELDPTIRPLVDLELPKDPGRSSIEDLTHVLRKI